MKKEVKNDQIEIIMELENAKKNNEEKIEITLDWD